MGRSFSEELKIDDRSLFFSHGIFMPESEAKDIVAALRAVEYPGIFDMILSGSAEGQTKYRILLLYPEPCCSEDGE